MDKACPILTATSEYEEPCMGERCAWYNKCFNPITCTASIPSNQWVYVDPGAERAPSTGLPETTTAHGLLDNTAHPDTWTPINRGEGIEPGWQAQGAGEVDR